MYGLIIALFLFIIYGIIEYQQHQNNRKKIPEIIHVNGTRGKSSVTRLIAGGLRAGGIATIAKTTGSAPVIIFEDGNEIPIKRHFSPNIREQLKIIKFASRRNINTLVLECMAVRPEYQWETEHKMVRSSIGVITNSRPDHLDVMGPGLRNVTLSLCNSIPGRGQIFTSENKVLPLMQKQAKKHHSQLISVESETVSDSDMKGFKHVEHIENVALALKVCEKYGISRETALKGMYEAKPDVGATETFAVKHKGKTIFFVHSFAANDPESTLYIIDYVRKLHPHLESVAFVLSTREDRMFRSKQLVYMMKDLPYDELFLVGQQTAAIKNYSQKIGISNKVTDCGWVSGEKFLQKVMKMPAKEILLFGIGNIHGNGSILVNYFKERHGKHV
ncbi:MAG: poly-gamma-glutamate synthase PgsB [Candidatus Cloacimonas sp. SDB]|nr:MAG: poly-gamma-glutamate synthase PgsB [Candidatus Cloacimonas sp. SDB]